MAVPQIARLHEYRQTTFWPDPPIARDVRTPELLSKRFDGQMPAVERSKDAAPTALCVVSPYSTPSLGAVDLDIAVFLNIHGPQIFRRMSASEILPFSGFLSSSGPDGPQVFPILSPGMARRIQKFYRDREIAFEKATAGSAQITIRPGCPRPVVPVLSPASFRVVHGSLIPDAAHSFVRLDTSPLHPSFILDDPLPPTVLLLLAPLGSFLYREPQVISIGKG